MPNLISDKPIEYGDRVRLIRANSDTRQDSARVEGRYLDHISIRWSDGKTAYVSVRSVVRV